MPGKFPRSMPGLWISPVARVPVMFTLPHGVLLYQGS
jgi:hypothetical protein